MQREKIQHDDSERRPGSQGRRYLTTPKFVPKEGMASGGLASIQRFANGGMPQGNMGMPKPVPQANMLMGNNAPKPPMGGAPRPPMGLAGALPPNSMNPMAPKPPMGGAPKPPMGMPKPPQMGGAPKPPMPPMPASQPAAPAGPMEPMDVLNSLASTGKVQPMPKPVMGMAGGGIAGIKNPQGMALSQMISPTIGGAPAMAAQNANQYLNGSTDGMADRIPASIDGQQPAALSDGEFVVPADVVSHLGNGNSNAGAQQLYSMMDRIRQARTGSSQQGRQINPTNYMPKV